MKAAVMHQHGDPDQIRIETGFPDPRPEAGAPTGGPRAGPGR